MLLVSVSPDNVTMIKVDVQSDCSCRATPGISGSSAVSNNSDSLALRVPRSTFLSLSGNDSIITPVAAASDGSAITFEDNKDAAIVVVDTESIVGNIRCDIKEDLCLS